MDDTGPEVARVMREAYRGMSAAQKLRRVVELNRTVDSLVRARLRAEHPEATERDLVLAIAALRYGEPMMRRVREAERRRDGQAR